MPLTPAAPVPLGPSAAPRLLARAAAGASVGCATLHGLVLAAGPWGWPAAGSAALVTACLLCAHHLWQGGGRTAWALHAALTVAMLAAHPSAGHHHGPSGGTAAWAATGAALLAALAFALCGVRAAWALRPGRGQSSDSGAGTPDRRVPQA